MAKENGTVESVDAVEVIEPEHTKEPEKGTSGEEKTETVEQEGKPNVPLGAILDNCTNEIRDTVYRIMQVYGIPASLMDYMLCVVLSETRDLKAKEYMALIPGTK